MFWARYVRFCSSVPYSFSIGRHMPWLMMYSPFIVGYLADTSRQIRSWARVRPAPPYSFG
ncbi:MAG: hypothetical protein R2715_11525 [Ilumatobacteraceae bacterium]